MYRERQLLIKRVGADVRRATMTCLRWYESVFGMESAGLGQTRPILISDSTLKRA